MSRAQQRQGKWNKAMEEIQEAGKLTNDEY